MLFIDRLLLITITCAVSFSARAQVCDANGNLFIVSNYDGGILTINVDIDIPNLVVAISSYEPIQVEFTGPFLNNVSQVIYAGFNSVQGNNNCGQGDFPTEITGVDPGIISISPPQNPPAVGYNPAHGNGNAQIIGAIGSCDTLINAGGVNTPDEIVYYFENTTSSQLYAHFTQYQCWQNEVLNLSEGGTCCIEPPQPEGCDPNGNLIVYSNYEGGVLEINIDQDIPNLKIGIVSYEATDISITGPFVGNVTEVIYAGFDAPSSGCGTNIPQTTVSGVAASIVTLYSITAGNIPIANFLGEALPGVDIPLVNCITGAEGDCSTSNDGGGNSAPQIVQFFLSEFGAGTVLYSHQVMYGCFGSPYNVSDGGNCCLTNTGTPPNPIYQPGASYDFIDMDEYSLCDGPLTIDLSDYPVLFQPPIYPGYVWSDGTQGPVITISEPGVYSFTAGDYCHFEPETYLTDTITVLACCTEPDAPNVSGDLLYCEDETITPLTAQATVSGTYTWYVDAGLNNVIATGAAFTPNNLIVGNNVYFVTINENECESDPTSVIVVVEPSPNVNIISSAGASICEAETTTLSNSINNANATFLWSTGETTPSIIANTTDTYTLTVAINGCAGVDSYELEVVEPPTVEIIGPLESCKDVPVTFTAEGATSYLWSNGTIGNTISIVATNDTLISVIGSVGGCSDEDEQLLTILFGPSIVTDGILTSNNGEPLEINATTDGEFLSWLPQGIVDCDTCSNTSLTTEIEFELLASAQSENGCLAFDTLTILVDNSCSQMFIPSAFTPNNSEPNEVFCIQSQCIEKMNFNIFDRWGKVVFATTDPAECWDGGVSGYYVPDGIYHWIVTGVFSNGEVFEKFGHVLVFR